MIRFVDLFCGIGGFHQALKFFDSECVLASDLDDECRRVYQNNFPNTLSVVGDIRLITNNNIDLLVPDHDILCGGFPCQPFSKSGKQQGVADSTRGTLFFEIVKILRVKKPKFVILENVRNITGPKHKNTWITIIESLRELGYAVSDEPLILSPHKIPENYGGSPQSRERVFIVGKKVDDPNLFPKGIPMVFPDITNFDYNSWDIESFLQNDEKIKNLNSYKIRREEKAWLEAWNDLLQSVNDFPSFPLYVDAFNMKIPDNCAEWQKKLYIKSQKFYAENKTIVDIWMKKNWLPNYTVKDFPKSRRVIEWQAKSAQTKRSERNIWKLVIQFRPSGIRVKPATYLPALVAINQAPIIGSRQRRITPVEAARLQGMPDNIFDVKGLSDANAYKQAGNAVNVGVVKYILDTILKGEIV